jgi:TRAP-type C4-dicarboxylate transport system permease small subunit
MLGRVAYYLQKGVSLVSRVSAIIGMALLVVLTLFISSDVILRRFFNAPISGSYEVTQFILGVIIFTTLAYCGVQGAHIVVDVIVLKFPKRVQSIIGLIIHLGSVATTCLISWKYVSAAVNSRNSTLLFQCGLPKNIFIAGGRNPSTVSRTSAISAMIASMASAHSSQSSA